MTTPVIRPVPRPEGAHSVARPLPPPPRVRQASEESRRPLDRVGRALEQWIKDLPVGATEAGD
jgi:hypothetical protein